MGSPAGPQLVVYKPPMPAHPTRLYLMRHGEPEGGRRYRGSQDDALSVAGWQQMRTALAELLSTSERLPERIVTSPLQRCHQFAAETAAAQQVPLIIEPGLREISFGDFEGMTPSAVWERYQTLLLTLWQDPTAATPPNGEPFQAFQARVKVALNALCQSYAGECLLLVIHGGVIRALLGLALDLTPAATLKLEVPYAAISALDFYAGGDECYPSLRYLNRFCG